MLIPVRCDAHPACVLLLAHTLCWVLSSLHSCTWRPYIYQPFTLALCAQVSATDKPTVITM